MGLFDIFKKKTPVEQRKIYTCARCKKEITDEETKWIGNHRFCNKCATPTKADTNAIQHSSPQSLNKDIGNVDIVAKTITPKCSSCGIAIPSTRTKCISCEWAENKFSNSKEIFKMITKEGQSYSLIYSGHTRYSPNRSSRCGYGSDEWMYLCEENGVHFILMFQDNAEYGTAWKCTQLLEEDFEDLVKEDVNYWGSVAYSKERTKTYAIHLTDVDSVRHLLPTSSRCCSKLTDEHYLR